MQLPEDSRQPVINRLKRARGQLTGVISMLEEGGDCEAVLTQLAAVGKALDKAGFSIVTMGLKECLISDGSGEIDTRRLERVFLSLA
ncbi:MAG: metal-sensitive transcriptional regulator [Propionibacteriaceae bacterium]|nr:metal-sensitive transcriptional regulator [Propionibacteriaceae bacterium]